MMTTQIQPPPYILRRKELEARTKLSRSTIYNRIKTDPSFPKPISLGTGAGAGAVGWIDSEVTAWLEDRIAQRKQVACDTQLK